MSGPKEDNYDGRDMFFDVRQERKLATIKLMVSDGLRCADPCFGEIIMLYEHFTKRLHVNPHERCLARAALSGRCRVEEIFGFKTLITQFPNIGIHARLHHKEKKKLFSIPNA